VITPTLRPSAAPAPPPGAFEQVAAQLDALVCALGVDAEATRIRAIYATLCRRALALPLGAGPRRRSRLNQDGTPIQFATTVGTGPAALRLVTDPCAFDADGGTRMRAARDTMREAAELVGVEAELAALAPFLAQLAPEDAPELRADPAGAFWIGAAFAPSIRPRLRIYVNGGWGSPAARSVRLGLFAAHFERAEAWDDLAAHFPTSLAPLGLALTLAPGGQVRGAIYLRAFGLRLSDYVALALFASDESKAERIRAFGAVLLGADAVHPTPSAVLSFDFGPEPNLPAGLEFCAHCLYPDDTTANAELERLFASSHLDPAPYRALARALAPPVLHPGPPRLHSFIGADAKSADPAYTIYMKPDLSAAR
jgi:hypothetical protein